MKTIHLFEDGIYHIGNKAVAKCFLFGDEKDCIRFKEGIDHHLGALCDVLAYGFGKDEFRLAVKLKSRDEIESYYRKKYSKLYAESDFIPETTYIFAQAMANMQSGYAKYFNYRYDRDGGLMKGRYSRTLLESEEKLDQCIASIHDLEVRGRRSRIWTFRRKEDGFNLELITNSDNRSSRKAYENLDFASSLNCFVNRQNLDIRGQFVNLPPLKLSHKKAAEKIQNLIHFMFLKTF